MEDGGWAKGEPEEILAQILITFYFLKLTLVEARLFVFFCLINNNKLLLFFYITYLHTQL